MQERSYIETLAQLPLHYANLKPDELAVVFGKQAISFSELDRRSNQVAHGLMAEGVTSQQRVAILDRNSTAFLTYCLVPLKQAPYW